MNTKLVKLFIDEEIDNELMELIVSKLPEGAEISLGGYRAYLLNEAMKVEIEKLKNSKRSGN